MMFNLGGPIIWEINENLRLIAGVNNEKIKISTI